VVANLEARRVRSDFFDDACSLVTASHGIHGKRDVTGLDVIIGVAHTGGHHANLEFVLSWVVEFDVDNFPVSSNLTNDGSTSSKRHEFLQIASDADQRGVSEAVTE